MPTNLRSLFLLDPNVIFLNHGSFGACPQPVFEIYQDWQRRLERQPVRFLGREYTKYDREARECLGQYVNSDPNDIAFIPNATYGVNLIARSLVFQPGDEILSTNHEYGACDYTWEYVCQRVNATYIRQNIPLPVQSDDEIIEYIWQGVNPHTKLIYLSHITSPTALKLPIEKICARARASGIMTFIDGAHAPGQISLDLGQINPDFYTGNCHKWMLAPKGAAFIYTSRQQQSMIKPLVVSWGYHAELTSGSKYIDYLQWTGTRDPSACFAIPAAIKFMQENKWDTVRKDCHFLLQNTLSEITGLTGLAPIYPLESNFYHQMGVVPLPDCDTGLLKARLYDEYHIEIPITKIGNQSFIRLSIQGYNTIEDTKILIEALSYLLPQGLR